MQHALRILLHCALLLPVESMAQHAVEADAGAPRHLDTIVVSGVLPAPGLWELTRGSKRVLIMGTLTPAPARMQWHAPAMEARVAEAQVVLESPAVSVSADIGLFRGLLLWPAYNRSKRNPDGKSLKGLLAPETYARWRIAKSRYIGNDRKVETLRPIHAAKALFDAAVRRGV